MGQYEYAAAEEVFADVVAGEPAWLEARVNLAIATLNRQNEGDERLALEILAGVLADDADHARALYTSAILHLYLGEAEPATKALERVTELDAEDAYAAYFLGQSLLQAGDYTGAAERFLASLELDPYLRSAYWAGSQALRRVGRDDEATRLLTDYQRFETNPAARLAGFSYARMGPKAQALAVSPAAPAAVPKPAGPLFSEPMHLAEWADGAAAISTADIDGDGAQDLVLTAGGSPHVLLGDGAGSFVPAPEHPLAAATGARASLWGDIDDDGRIDAAFCGPEGAHRWQQPEAGVWTQAGTLDQPCTAAALADADHDGDLDIFVTGEGGFELFNNNRDGTFRRLAAERGLQGGAGRQVVVVDLDSDRDLDILVVNENPPHDIWENELTWAYAPLEGLDDLRGTQLAAVTVIDADADGHREIYGVGPDGLQRWRYDGVSWSASTISTDFAADATALDGADFDGDQRLGPPDRGRQRLVHRRTRNWQRPRKHGHRQPRERGHRRPSTRQRPCRRRRRRSDHRHAARPRPLPVPRPHPDGPQRSRADAVQRLRDRHARQSPRQGSLDRVGRRGHPLGPRPEREPPPGRSRRAPPSRFRRVGMERRRDPDRNSTSPPANATSSRKRSGNSRAARCFSPGTARSSPS